MSKNQEKTTKNIENKSKMLKTEKRRQKMWKKVKISKNQEKTTKNT